MERPLALVVGGDVSTRDGLCRAIGEQGLTALCAVHGAEIDDLVHTRPVRLLFVDVTAPGVELPQLLAGEHRLPPASVVVALLPGADERRQDQLIEAGAFDTVASPVAPARLRGLVHRAVREQELLEELRALQDQRRRREGFAGLVGRSAPMQRLRERLSELALLDGGVWFHGESGSGKEHAARALHELQHEGDGSFVVVPCAGMTMQGWLRTWSEHGGGSRGPGNDAPRGSLLLEDLPDGPLEVQQRVAESLAARVPGGFRLLASSSADPLEHVETGQLLPDLHRRFGAATLRVPPLRERGEDVLFLARHFLERICEINRLPPIRLEADALQVLEAYRWPGNVRELRNALEQAAILSADGRIHARNLPDRLRGLGPRAAGSTVAVSAARRFRDAKRDVVDAFERAYLDDLMERHDGNVTAAARQAGMLRSALQRLLRKCGMRSAEFRSKRAREGARAVSHAAPD